jgi:hypothetical protein
MGFHFSSVHTLILTLQIDVAEMKFVKLLRNLLLSINIYPSCIRPVGTVIRTFESVEDGGGFAAGDLAAGANAVYASPGVTEGV